MRIRIPSGGAARELRDVSPGRDYRPGGLKAPRGKPNRAGGSRAVAKLALTDNLYIIVLSTNTINGSCPRPE